MSQYIYFIQRESDDLIKIGHSTRVPQRLAHLRTKHGQLELLGLIPGTIRDERLAHKQFDYCRSSLEWFTPDNELLYYIDTVARPYPLRIKVND